MSQLLNELPSLVSFPQRRKISLLLALAGSLLALLLTSRQVHAQGVPDTIQRVLDLHAIIERHGQQAGPRIWPGFRPDTIPTLYVIAHRGKVLVQWRHEWPAGFTVLDGRPETGIAVVQTGSLPSGRFLSFMSVDSAMSPGLVLGTSIHEAFHSYERSVLREGQVFGGGENAMLVGTYPVFDVENEAAFALEGRKLRQALAAESTGEATRLAREFLALRERRQRVLDTEFTEFEKMAEMNEGLAQYALIRGLAEIARLEGGPWAARAREEARLEAGLLDSLLQMSRRSVRRRFYATGSAMALLLDRFQGPAWKERVVKENLLLQDALSQATGFLGTSSMGPAWSSRADRDLARVLPEAARSVARLKAIRSAQADSLLSGPGLRLIIDATGLGSGALQWCGFDPQNTLQTGDGRTLHMRFLQVCAGARAKGEFSQAVVQSDSSGSILTVLDPATLTLTSEAGPLRLNVGESAEVNALRLAATNISLEASRARVARSETGLTVLLLDVR